MEPIAGIVTSWCLHEKSARYRSIPSELASSWVSCELEQYSNAQTTCNCTIQTASTHPNGRTLYTDDQKSVRNSDPIDFHIFAVLESRVFQLFTWDLEVFVLPSYRFPYLPTTELIYILDVIFIMSALTCWIADRISRRIPDKSRDIDVINRRNQCARNRVGKGWVMTNDKTISEELRFVELCLPILFSEGKLWRHALGELLLYHRWLGIVFHFSPAYSRYLRLVSLFSRIHLVLAMVSLTSLPSIYSS